MQANIPYDSRGFPIFDDISKYTTTIKKPDNYELMDSDARRKAEMVQATIDLKDGINSGKIDPSNFTKRQLDDIQNEKAKVTGYTWHHNAQSSPNNFQLIPTKVHDETKHVGEASMSEGKQ